MKAMQLDWTSLAAPLLINFLKHLSESDLESSEMKMVVKELLEWDCKVLPESRAAAFYHVVLYQ